MSEQDIENRSSSLTPRPDHATIVCADIVGYSRLIGEDETTALESVVYCRERVTELATEQSGRLFNMAGDGFMLKFEHSDQAVQFSLALQQDLAYRNREFSQSLQTWMRIGIACGRYVDLDGQLYGDTVNIAARLQETSSPGAVVISSDVLEGLTFAVQSPLHALGDLILKNINHAVSAFEIQFQTPKPNALDLVEKASLSRDEDPFSDRSAIAVLPFEFDRVEPELSYLAEGICEDLITSLSHVRHFPVISKASSFAVASAEDSPQKISELLGVRYLVTGRLSGNADALRQSIQLIDASTNQVLWVEKYTLDKASLFDQLETVTSQIVSTLTTQLEGVEGVKARTKRRSQTNVHDLVWRARWHFNRLGKKDADEGKRLLDEALLISPNHPEALIQLAFWHHLDAWKAQKPREVIEENLRIAHRAIKEDEFDSRGYLAAALAEILLRNFERALVHCERAVQLNPSYAHAYAEIGTCNLYMGRPQDAIEPFETSLKLNPQDYYVFNILAQVAQAHCQLGNWDDSLRYARRSSSLKPNFWLPQLCELTSLERNGQLRAAAHASAHLLKTVPNFERETIAWLPFRSSEEVDYFYESFVRAHAEAVQANLVDEPTSSDSKSNVTQITPRA